MAQESASNELTQNTKGVVPQVENEEDGIKHLL